MIQMTLKTVTQRQRLESSNSQEKMKPYEHATQENSLTPK